MNAAIKLSSAEARRFWEIPILFEDEHLLALDKPADLPLTAEVASPEEPCLMYLLHGAIASKKPWTTERQLSFLADSHFFDNEASGIVLLAKSKSVLATLANQFGTDKPGFQFVTLVIGEPAVDSFVMDAKIAPHPARPDIMRVDPVGGKKSKTLVDVAERFRGWTLVNCQPANLRAHQIRVHLRHAGFPICGDSLYGGRPLLLSRLKTDYRLKEGRTEKPLIASPVVHAEQLQMIHPITGSPITVTSPWPKTLRVATKYLREFAR